MRNTICSILALSLLALSSCSSDNGKTKERGDADTLSKETKKPAPNPYANSVIEVRVFNNDTVKQDVKSTGYGYDIYIDGQRYIHQYSIPAMPGNNGFKTPEAARKAGEFIAHKVRNNIMPPAVSPQELDSIGVLK
ncbi:MAG: DUF4907 domain-containing protein [Bacteroidota bacterium]